MSARGRGSLLVITLWVVAILAVLAVAIGRYMSLEVKIAHHRMVREQARTLARSGIYLAMQRLTQDETMAYDGLDDHWASFAGEHAADPSTWVLQIEHHPEDAPVQQVTIRIVDEERKLPLNGLLSQPAFLTAAQTLFHSPELAAQIIDATDLDEVQYLNSSMPESDEHRQPPYVPKNAILFRPEELRELPGLAALPIGELQHVMALTSVYQPAVGATLNLNTVPIELLSAMGFSDELTARLTECRSQTPPLLFTDAQRLKTNDCLPGPLTLQAPEQTLLSPSLFGVASKRFTITSEGSVGQPAIRAHVEAVVERSAPSGEWQWPTVIAWNEG